jgi:hypothetical protein
MTARIRTYEVVNANREDLNMVPRNIDEDRIRISVFDEFPECLMVFVPKNTELLLPLISAPFVVSEIAKACADSGIKATVRTGRPGRWSTEARRQLNDEKAMRRQLACLADAAKAAKLVSSEDSIEKERGALLLRKFDIDTKLRALRVDMTKAKQNAALNGIYLPRQEYRRMAMEIDSLATESQAIQVRLSEIKNATGERLLNHFISAAREMLDESTFNEILDVARDMCTSGESIEETGQ